MMTLRKRWAWAWFAMLLLLGACGGGNDGPGDPQPSANTPPTANAGADQVVAQGAAVTLSGAGSTDANGTIAAYAWTQTGGTAITLSSASAAAPTFTAPSISGALTFQLTVTDNGGASHSDTVTITVNAPPLANAGADQTVSAGAAVSLSGSGTDSDGTIASYAWNQTAGDAVTLSGANTATLAFIAPDAATSLTFQLTVTDNHGTTHADSATVTVAAAPPPPPPPPPPSAPAIGRQPTSPKAYEYGSALIFVAASGEDLTYTWYSTNFGTLIKSGAEPWLLRRGLDESDDGNCYHVVISNSAGTVTSEPGCVTVFAMEGELDPFKDEDDGMGGDDQGYASAFGNTLMNVAELVAGALTGPSLEILALPGTLTGVPRSVEVADQCYVGSYDGATLDGASVTAARYLPTGAHSVSLVWNECRDNSDDEVADDGGVRIDFDFPEQHGEGTFTIYLSGYEYEGVLLNGIVQATVTVHGAGTTDRWDQIDMTVGEDFSSPALRVTSALPQTISIKREYNDDRTRMDDTLVDFDVTMTAFDGGGSAGTIFQSGGAITRLRWVDDGGDTGEPTHVSNEKFSVGLSGGFHLATLQASFGQFGWGFSVLAPEDCPEGTICVDPPPLP